MMHERHLKLFKRKMEKVMGEFKRGTLKSSNGHMVTNRDHALVIAFREAGIPAKKKKRKRG